MTPYRLIAFAAALAITLFLAIAPGLMVEVAARHRQSTAAEQRIAVDQGIVGSLRNTRGVSSNRGSGL
jgi:hypothetical protein